MSNHSNYTLKKLYTYSRHEILMINIFLDFFQGILLHVLLVILEQPLDEVNVRHNCLGRCPSGSAKLKLTTKDTFMIR